MKPTIRTATPEDAAALMRLIHECVAAMRAGGIEQWDEVYPNAQTVDTDIATGSLHVLCEGDRIIGCVTVDQQTDPLWKDLDWNPAGEPPAAVHRLMIHPMRQKQGHAKTLMNHAEAVARNQGCHSIRLDSFIQNPAAMALYGQLRYRPTGSAEMRKGRFTGFEKMLEAAATPSPG